MRHAHLVNYEKKHGPVPKGKILDHVICDTRVCCNPDHVAPSSQANNVRRGHNTKLTLKQVKAIRKHAARGKTYREIAREFQIHRQHVYHIVAKKRWREN